MTHTAWHGDLVTLRDVEPSDWEAYQSLEADTDAFRHGWQINWPRSAEALRAWAEEMSKKKPENDNHFWTIVDAEGCFVGTINTHQCDSRHGTFEYGISIDRPHWGKGYGQDAIRVVLRYFFDELGYAKVHAFVYAYNDRSISMHEKFGMVREGQLREAHYTGGKRHDVLIYGMTAPEFRSRYG